MDENFLPTSISSDLGSSENSGNFYSFSDLSVLPPPGIMQISDATNAPEYQSFFNDDDFRFSRFSTMTRWQSAIDNLNLASNSSNRSAFTTKRFPIKDFCAKENISSSLNDVLISPMSRLSTSSSFRSFNSTGSYKTSEHSSSQSTLANSTDQLIVSSESVNLMPSLPSLLPLPTYSSHRQILSTIDNMPSVTTDNDLQQVPPSFIVMQSSSAFGNTPIAHPHPQSHMVQSAGRSNSMPSWRGYLPVRIDPTTIDQHQMITHFSQKVFLGGIPPELTEAELLLVLRRFGKCNIKWPKNDGVSHNMPGFCHVVFRESRSVCELLKHCTRQQRSTIDYFLHIHMSPTTATTASGIPARTNRLKPIQVVPWNVQDNVFVMHEENISNGDASQRDWSRTIFVSPLHGKMTAFSLATIMSNVFGPVSMAQINTDKYGYPTGTGTVLFCDSHSYMRGVAAGAIDIKCDCFHKLLDIDPFLRENERCAHCSSAADLFCRNFHCLRSYCKQCWVNRHGPKPLADHQPATRRLQIL